MNSIVTPVLTLSSGNFYFNRVASALINTGNAARPSIKFDFVTGKELMFTNTWDDENPALNYILFERNNCLRLYSPRLHKRMIEFYGLLPKSNIQLDIAKLDGSVFTLQVSRKSSDELQVSREEAEVCKAVDYSPESNYKFRNRPTKRWEQGLYGLI